ncbi:MAG: sugar transferase [Gracilibacteraceae bacterium]|jgi:lipopolysaccharide/colanic/teichoic acid biosynthesis glycosyltransferase|nr:sugar transferase [Gracilibacteraceae bacterium]
MARKRDFTRTGAGGLRLYEKYFKRGLDILLAGGGLILLSPLYLALALLIRRKLGAPVIFAQRRPGLNGKLFSLYKFRSMTDERDADGVLLPDSRRLTAFGAALRSTSLDELPELWNVLRGDMSLVGPRPQLIRDMAFFDEKTMRRQSVPPGLTGLAQINGRNTISWDEKFTWDLRYIERISFAGDMRIMWRTLRKIFTRADVTAAGMATAEDYGDYLLRLGRLTRAEYERVLAEIES